MSIMKRILSLALACVMVLGMIPAMEAEAASVEYGEVMGYISTGDSTFVASEIPMYTKESMDALLDMYQDFGMNRVYWRGLQNELWNQTQYTLQNGIRGTYHSEGVREQFLEFEAQQGMTIDEYFVTEAHKRGIQVYGVTSLSDWGSGADIPINGWPAGHNAIVREENPDWVPKDKYGLVDQGGAMEFSIEAVRDWYVDLHVNEIEQVGYDGVLFITYSENYSINYNDQFGFSDEAVTEFYNRYGVMAGREAFTKWASIYDWQRLRGEYVTELFRELKTALNADGEEEDVCLFLDARDPWHMQVWNANETLTNGIYMDLWTYVDEGLIDQFVVNGASTLDAQMTTTQNMLQLCEGTGTSVAINTSNAGNALWDELQAQGVDILTYGSGEAMLYNRSEIAGKQTDDPILAAKLWLARVAESKTTQNLTGSGTVTLNELKAYLDESAYDVTVRRLALHAIMTLKPEGGTDVVEQVLLNDSDSGVRAMAAHVLRFIGDAGSVDALIEAIYTYDEFAMVEAASVALYNNVNASSWRATLRSKFAEYSANDYNSGSDDNLRICASLLRALNYVGEASDLALYQSLVEEFGPNDNTEVLLDYDLSEVQARQEDVAAVLEKMDHIVQEMWYDAIRYYAAAGIGNINSTAAFEELYALAQSDDTIVSTPALVALGNRATSSIMTGEYRTQALAVLDAVFGECGDGSTRVDKDWAYRPIGAALQKYGDDGTAILEKYLNGDDKILALFAWRDLYIPWTPGAYNEMTTSEYEEAYLQLPDSLKEFNVQKLAQGWENKSLYDQAVPTSTNGYVGDAASSAGRWGTFNAGGVEISDFTRESSDSTQSLKMVRGSGTGWSVTGTFGSITEGQAYNMSFWLYRTNGATMTFASRSAAADYEIQGLIGDGGKLVFWDVAANKWGSDAVLTVPEDQWVQLTMNVSRLSGEITVSMTTEDGVTETAETKIPFNVATKVDRVVFTMSTVVGGTAYLDDISILVASAVRPERSQGASITMDSASVRYDGAAHTLSATANLIDNTVPTVTYKNAYDADAEATTEAPVDAGTYLVTATAEYEGVTYTAEATLTIVPAIPTIDSSKITATAIAYGQKLNESQLTMEEGALTGIDGSALEGTVTWNNGAQYPVDTAEFTYTVNPTDKNYASVSGSVKVKLEEPKHYQQIEKFYIDQDFEYLTWAASGSAMGAGDAATSGGRWLRQSDNVAASQVMQLSGTTNNTKALTLYRDASVHKPVSVSVTSGVSAGTAYVLEYDFYRNASQGATLTVGGKYAFIIYDSGYLRLYDNDSATWSKTNEMTVPANEWVTFRMEVAADGSYVLTMTQADGTVTTAPTTGYISTAAAVTKAEFTCVTKGGDIAYIDNFSLSVTELVESVPVVETVYVDQDFNDSSKFTNGLLEGATSYKYIYGSGTEGANWNLHPTYITVAQRAEADQCIALQRLAGESSAQFTGTSEVAVAADSTNTYIWSFDLKTDSGTLMTMNIGTGSTSNYEASFIIGPNYIQSIEDTSAKISFTQGQWVNATVTVDREEGTCTIAVGNSSATFTSDKIGTFDATRISVWGRIGQANNYCYVDNVKFTQIAPAITKAYEETLSQDFEDTTIFNAENTDNAVGVKGSIGGNWSTSGGYAIVPSTEQFAGESGQSIPLVRGGAQILYGNLAATPDDNMDYEIEFKYYRPSGIGFTGTFFGEIAFHAVNDGRMLFTNGTTSYTYATGVSPVDQWVTVKLYANRDTGNYTITMLDDSGNQLFSGTAALTDGADNRITFNAQASTDSTLATPYVSAYIDDVKMCVEVPNYDIVDVALGDTIQTYDGSAKAVSVSAGDATEYTVWYNGSTAAPTEAGTYSVEVLVTQYGYRGSTAGTLTIRQAEPDYAGEAISYVEVAKDSALSEIDLGISFTTPGVLAWDGDASAALTVSGDYGWTFTPADASNYAAVGGSVYINVQGGEDAVAQVGETTYASLAQAVEKAEAGSTVTVIANISEPGVAITKSLTVDFSGKAYTVTNGTMTFSEGATVELKNGTIAGSVGMLLQNAADLTLTDMVLNTTGTAIYNGPDRALTVNYTNAPETVTVTGGITVNGAENVTVNGGIFTAAISDSWCADGYQAVQLADGTWTVMDKDLCNGAKIGDVYYAELAQAIEAAADGETVVMLRSAAMDSLFISGSKILDLNGNELAVPNGIVTFEGQVVDSSDGIGVLLTGASNVVISEANAQLPLYDSAAGGYRFFSYSFDSLGAYTHSTTNNAVFGMRLTLTNADGYALLANADNGMTLKVKLSWEGMESQAPEYSFSSDLMSLYAAKIQQSTAYALILRVTGAEGKTLTVEPTVETVSRMSAAAEAVTHTVEAAE